MGWCKGTSPMGMRWHVCCRLQGSLAGFAAHTFGSNIANPILFVDDMTNRVGLRCCWGPQWLLLPLVAHFQTPNLANFGVWRQWARLVA